MLPTPTHTCPRTLPPHTLQILYPYIWMKTHNRDKPHVWDDWLFFIRCNWQTAWGKAPTNKRLDQLVDWLLMPKIGNNWWYNTLYRAIMQTTARRSAGAAARRGGRGKEMVRGWGGRGRRQAWGYGKRRGE